MPTIDPTLRTALMHFISGMQTGYAYAAEFVQHDQADEAIEMLEKLSKVAARNTATIKGILNAE